MSYVDELSRELERRGIGGATRRRILDEVDDHLRSEPDAQERFGAPAAIANEFAAELGSHASRRAAFVAFAALAVAGAVYAAAFVSHAFANPPSETLAPTLGAVALAAMVVAPQIAFVAGALALYAHEFAPSLAGWWTTATYASTSVAGLLLLAASVPAARAARFRPELAGSAGDVFDDLGFASGDPWRLAATVAVAVGAAVWLAGIVQGDPIDGLARGMFEAAACLAGFAALGRYLGLRR